jgi:hypothetical protein
MALIRRPSADGGDFLFMYGGTYSTDSLVNQGDDWGFSLDSLTWFPVSIPDIPRRTHAILIAPPDAPYAILYGGVDSYGNAVNGTIYSINFGPLVSPTELLPLQQTPETNTSTSPDRYEGHNPWTTSLEPVQDQPSILTPSLLTPESPTISCSQPPPSPLSDFTCVNSVWVSETSITTPSLVISPGGIIQIHGNLSVTDITFNGIGASVQVVNGCVIINGTIILQLSEEDIDSVAQRSLGDRQIDLITQDPECSWSSQAPSLSVKTKKSCRKVSAKANIDDSERLSALFSIDSSWCQNRWIILGCVLGGVILIALILMLVFTQSKKARECVRPYSARDQIETTSSSE